MFIERISKSEMMCSSLIFPYGVVVTQFVHREHAEVCGIMFNRLGEIRSTESGV